MAALRFMLAGLSLALVVRADFQEDHFRLRDAGGLRPAVPFDADRQRSEGAFRRAPVQQLSLAEPSNGSFDVAKNAAAPASGASGAGLGAAPAGAAVPAGSNVSGPSPFERSAVHPVFGMEQHPGGAEPGSPRQLLEQDVGKLQRRKFRMRHRKSLRERKARRLQRLVDDEMGSAGVAQEAYAQQRPAEQQPAAAQGMVAAASGAASARLEALAGLKVEYARAYIAAEEPEADSGPMELLCTVGFKDYASITWTVNGRPLENFIDRSTLTTTKNDVPVKVSKITINQLERLPSDNGKFVFECTALVDAQVTKATIALGSIIEDSCQTNAQCEPRGASCSEGRCLCKPSQPVSLKSKHLTCRAAAGLGWPCDYSEQCVFSQPNAVCTDRLVCDCALGFIKSLDGKTCDKLTANNLIGQPCKASADCHAAGAACLKEVCACANDTVERNGLCLPEEHLKMGALGVRGPNSLSAEDAIKTQNDTRLSFAAAVINEAGDKKETTSAPVQLGVPVRSSAPGLVAQSAALAGAFSLVAMLGGR